MSCHNEADANPLIDEALVDFSSPMFTLVNPNEIYPYTNTLVEVNENPASIINTVELHTSAGQLQYSQLNQQTDQQFQYPQNIQQQHHCQQVQTQYLQHQNFTSQIGISGHQKQALVSIKSGNQLPIKSSNENYQQFGYLRATRLDSPPTLIRREEPKYRSISKRLQLDRALSQQRQERLRLQLEKQTSQSLNQTMRKGSGKKMTGRERQQELEKQEAQLLRLREHHLLVIDEYERRCNRLRQILQEIVKESPDYDTYLANFLDPVEVPWDQENQGPSGKIDL